LQVFIDRAEVTIFELTVLGSNITVQDEQIPPQK